MLLPAAGLAAAAPLAAAADVLGAPLAGATLAAAAGLIAVFVAAIASPYLLMRHLHSYRTVRAKPRARQHLRKHWVSSGRLGSPQPKGVP